MADKIEVEKGFVLLESMSNLRGYPYGKKQMSATVHALLKAADGNIELLGEALQYFRTEVDEPHVPLASEVRTYLYVEMARLDASTRIKVLKSNGEPCEKCGGDGRYIAEGWKRCPLRPRVMADKERGRPGRSQGKRWTSWVEYCGCAIGKIRKNLHSKAAA